MDCTPPGFSVHGILQARILEWVTMPFSKDLPNPGIESALQADSLPSEPPGSQYFVLEEVTKLLKLLRHRLVWRVNNDKDL